MRLRNARHIACKGNPSFTVTPFSRSHATPRLVSGPAERYQDQTHGESMEETVELAKDVFLAARLARRELRGGFSGMRIFLA